MDGEDLASPLLLAASCGGGRVVFSLLARAQQPVGHQLLPGATEVRSVRLHGRKRGGPTNAIPDCVAGGEDSDSVIPERGEATDETESNQLFKGTKSLSNCMNHLLDS